MKRPTIAQVENALAAVERNDEDCGSVVVSTLAAEVLALHAAEHESELRELRRNLQLFRDAHEAAELRIVELREELEALRAKE